MAKCQNQERNSENCTCTYPCERRGICCECVTYHRRLGEIPGCFFTKEGEKQWDRSVAALMADRS